MPDKIMDDPIVVFLLEFIFVEAIVLVALMVIVYRLRNALSRLKLKHETLREHLADKEAPASQPPQEPPPPTRPATDEKDNLIQLLRERVRALKASEKDQHQLEMELQRANDRIEILENRHQRTLESLNRIRQINRSLNMISSSSSSQPWVKIEDIPSEERFNFAMENVDNARNSLDAIGTLNQHKQALSTELLETVATEEASPEINQFLKDRIQTLQTSLAQSDSEILALNKQIHCMQKQLQEQHQPGRSATIEIETSRSSVESNVTFASDNDGYDLQAGRRMTLDQIRSLQNNNSEQRNIIVDLKREIQTLQKELQSHSDLTQEEVKAKIDRIADLEAMIKECDHCISILESEVEMLYSQVANIEDQEQLDNGQSKDNQEIERLTQELTQMTDMMNNTMTLYGDQSIVTKFAMESAAVSSIKELMVLLDSTVRAMGPTPAIDIRTKIVNASITPESEFHAADIKRLKTAKASDQAEKPLLYSPRIAIMATNLPKDPERKIQMSDNLSLLKNISAAGVDRLESSEISRRQQKTLEKLLAATQREIQNIEVQQNYQSQELHSVLNKLMKEVYNITNSIDLAPALKNILKNAIEETQERSALLLASGSLVTDGFSRLINNLNDKLEKDG
jgi:hypothetical protein